MGIGEASAAIVFEVGTSYAASKLTNFLQAISTRGKLLSLYLASRNSRARVSFSAFIRIKRHDGKYLLIRNRHRPELFSPIGGCFKYFPSEVSQIFERYHFIDEYQIIDSDIQNDLRGYTIRRCVPSLINWFEKRDSARESGSECLRREIDEEIIREAGISDVKSFIPNLSFRFSHSYIDISKSPLDFGTLTQVKLFEMYDLNRNQDADALGEALSGSHNQNILWATARDIMLGRCSETNRPLSAPSELFVRRTIKRQTLPPPNQLHLVVDQERNP